MEAFIVMYTLGSSAWWLWRKCHFFGLYVNNFSVF